MNDLNQQLIVLFQKYKTLILWSIGSAVLSIVLILFVIIPQLIQIRQTNDAIAANQQKISAFEAKVKTLQAVNKDEYQKDLGTTLIALPAEKDLPASLDQLQILLAKDKLQLNTITFAGGSSTGTDTSSSGLQSYQIKVEIIGSASALKGFINDLKTAPQLMKLSGIDITASQGGLVQDDLILTAYYEAPPSSLGSIDQQVNLLSSQEKSLIDTLSQNTQSVPLITSSVPLGPRGKSDPFQ